MTLSITTRETIRFTVGQIRHPEGYPGGTSSCSSCDTEAANIAAALLVNLNRPHTLLERIQAAPKPRGLCRWHPWGCPSDRGYYEGPRVTLAGPPLDINKPHRFVNDDDPATWQEL